MRRVLGPTREACRNTVATWDNYKCVGLLEGHLGQPEGIALGFSERAVGAMKMALELKEHLGQPERYLGRAKRHLGQPEGHLRPPEGYLSQP